MPLSSLAKARAIARVALDGLAEDAVILDMRRVASFCDYFVICQARSSLHIDAIHDRVVEAMAQEGLHSPRREGARNSTWVVLDYVDVVLHIFDEPTRAFYDLERLWSDAQRVALTARPDDRAGAEGDRSA